MSADTGLIYEVTLKIDSEIIESFDIWLAQHVEEMLAIPGFEDATVFTLEDDNDGRAQRVTQYFLGSEQQLQAYFADQADAMRQSGVDHFGDQFSASRRILKKSDFDRGQGSPPEICANCDTILTGQYCGNCGQRARGRLIGLWELISDAFGDLFELDSRIWRTMVPLLTRPGKLTYDYLQGKRARFMPPFRTYLVLSVLFFIVLLFNPKDDFSILFEPEPETPGEIVENGRHDSELREAVSKELEEEGIRVPDFEKDKPEGVSDDSDPGDDDDECDVDDLDNLDIPEWVARRLTKKRLAEVCEKVMADDGKALGEKLIENIPAALFLLLPLMAFVLKLLYPLSKRYYVEHLLFVVHYHAFFFLLLILQTLFSRLILLLRFPEAMIAILVFAISFYIAIYLYKAMRRVYGQGHLATAPKFIAMVIAYLAGLSAVFGLTALFAVFSL